MVDFKNILYGKDHKVKCRKCGNRNCTNREGQTEQGYDIVRIAKLDI